MKDAVADMPKKRGPKPKGDRPMTGAERARLHRERINAATKRLRDAGFTPAPLFMRKEGEPAIEVLAKELGIPALQLLAGIADEVLIRPLVKYAALTPDTREAVMKAGDGDLFDIHWAIFKMKEVPNE